MKLFWLIVVWLWVSVGIQAEAEAQQVDGRRALVIGNSDYAYLGQLKNPRSDVTLVSTTLRAAGFRVDPLINKSRDELREALSTFAGRASSADAAIVYYAGHGADVDGRSWLFPVESDAGDADRLSETSIEVEELVRATAGARVRLVVIDACRNNPFTTLTRGATARGAVLSAYESGEAIIFYAASRGHPALDGVGPNSPFAVAFSEAISQQGLELRPLLPYIRRRTEVLTDGAQQPRITGAYPVQDFYFRARDPSRVTTGVPPSGSPARGTLARSSVTRRAAVKDCDVCPELMRLPRGQFLMGSPRAERDRSQDEGPQHWVQVSGFAIGLTEITFNQWEACAREGGCGGNQPSDNGWGQGDRPVINVSRVEALKYIGWLSRKTGQPYRLPTESEWEYATRGGQAEPRPYWWSPNPNRPYANYGPERLGFVLGGVAEGADTFKYTAPAKSFQPNPYGLYDMHGNVSEFVEDCYVGSYSGAPLDGSAVQKDFCLSFVVRGGTWDSYARDIRSASRSRIGNNERRTTVGFRVARSDR